MKTLFRWNKGQFSWAMFDWANQPFFTVIYTFIFAPYFTSVVIGDSVEGQAIWAYLTALSAAVIAICSPIFGSMADAQGPRKPWIFMFSLVGAVSCLGLWYAIPGFNIYIPMLSFVMATIAIEIAIIFNNAMLPTIANQNEIGRLSGFAWGMGYIGGLIPLFLLMFLFIWTDNPLFGLDKSSYEPERFSAILSGIWLILFVIPMMLFTKDTKKSVPKIPRMQVIKSGFSNLKTTFKNVTQFKNIWIFLIARSLYNDAILVVISFSGIYAVATFNWDTTGLGIFAIIVNIIAFFGCLVGGWLDDKLGSKMTIYIFVSGLFLSLLGVISITGNSALFGIIKFANTTSTGFMTTPSEFWFMAFGLILGFCFGPAQSASRTMMARITPPEKMAEFFGLFAFSGKATGFLAPLAIGIVTTITQSNRLGLAVVLVFFALGLFILKFTQDTK